MKNPKTECSSQAIWSAFPEFTSGLKRCISALTTLLIGTCILTFSSCHRKAIGTKITETKADKSRDLFNKSMEAAQPDFKWMRIRAKMRFEGGGNDNTAATLLKIRKDSAIFGMANVIFEVGRGLIRQDTAYMVNHLQRNYASFAVAEMQRTLAIENLDYKAIQNLFFAIPPFPVSTYTSFAIDGNTYKLGKQGTSGQEDFILDAASLRMKEYSYKRNESDNIHITYSNFEKVGEMALPKKIFIVVHKGEETKITFEISSYNLLDADEIRFSVPSGYKNVR